MKAVMVEETEEFKIRRLLWLNHSRYLPFNHSPYGDDGEMQCCGIDFKRDSAEAIERRLDSRTDSDVVSRQILSQQVGAAFKVYSDGIQWKVDKRVRQRRINPQERADLSLLAKRELATDEDVYKFLKSIREDGMREREFTQRTGRGRRAGERGE